jgi:hypothetical protein
MGFFDVVTGKKSLRENPIPNVQLTPKGEKRIAEGLIHGLEFDCAVTIKKIQPCSVSEVAREIGRPENKVRYAMTSLKNDHLIEVLQD